MSDFPALDVGWSPGPDTAELCDLLYAALDEFEPLAIDVHAVDDGAEDAWRVFFRSGAQRDRARDAIGASLGHRLLSIASIDVPDEGWARRSQSALRAIRIGRIVVAPPWDAASEPGMQIVIDPSTGFGTGHHETTRLCLGILQDLDFPAGRVLDVGTGSGVLAIAAAMLGAVSVTAVDNDPEALRNARENIERNGRTDRITVLEADLATLVVQPADLVIANLTAAVLARYAIELRRLLAPRGALLVSGFGPHEREDVADALLPLRVRREAREGEWMALLCGAAYALSNA